MSRGPKFPFRGANEGADWVYQPPTRVERGVEWGRFEFGLVAPVTRAMGAGRAGLATRGAFQCDGARWIWKSAVAAVVRRHADGYSHTSAALGPNCTTLPAARMPKYR